MTCLIFFFNYGKEYRTIYLHRSAISEFHKYDDGVPIEKHPSIYLLVCGAFNLRSPKHSFFLWNIKKILGFVKENFNITINRQTKN